MFHTGINMVHRIGGGTGEIITDLAKALVRSHNIKGVC